MITPPPFNSPPAVGVKANVAATGVLPATRSVGASVNEGCKGAPPITPEDKTADINGSALVCTVTSPPAVAAPMVKPESVMVTALEAAIEPVATVTAMEAAPDVAVLKVAPDDAAAEIEAVPETKKPNG